MSARPAFASSVVCTVERRPSSSDGVNGDDSAVSRRRALRLIAAAAVTLSAVPSARATIKLGKPSTSDLLHQIERERSAEEIEAEKTARADARRERLARQNQLQREAERRRAEGIANTDENQTEIEANLRANYYYPTARKRYLPRVKKASDDVRLVKAALANGQWDEAGRFVNGGSLDNCVVPMKLYVSSLAGQGLSLATRFTRYMSDSAENVDQAIADLKTAIKRRDIEVAMAALSEMESEIAKYRTYGKLQDPDFGIGEVPKDARIGSGLGNNNPTLYRRNYAEKSTGQSS